MSARLFRDDPYQLEFDALVLERLLHEGRPAVVLDRTAFYAESGGQPWDTGTLDDAAVLAVVERQDGSIVHVLDRPLAQDEAHGKVDGARRADHRQQHHGQHLLSRALVEVASAATVSFHLGAAESTIDLDRELAPDLLRAAERRANQVIWEARPVRVRSVTRAEAMALGVRAPDDAGDDVRLVEAEGFDLQPCGGTHPRNTAEVGVVLVLGSARYKGGARLRFVCGARALDATAQRTALLDRLGVRLSAPLDGLEQAAEGTLQRLAEAERRCKDLLSRALEGEARRLLAATTTPGLVVARLDGWPVEDLRGLASWLVRLAPCVALLGAASAGTAQLVFAQSDGLGHDVPALLRASVALLGGRGGGRGNLAQGGGERVDQLDAALAAATASLR